MLSGFFFLNHITSLSRGAEHLWAGSKQAQIIPSFILPSMLIMP